MSAKEEYLQFFDQTWVFGTPSIVLRSYQFILSNQEGFWDIYLMKTSQS